MPISEVSSDLSYSPNNYQDAKIAQKKQNNDNTFAEQVKSDTQSKSSATNTQAPIAETTPLQ